MIRILEKNKVLCAVLGLILLTVAVAQGDHELTVEEIQRAIGQKNARWEARETSVMRLSAEERHRLCGAQLIVPAPGDIKPPPVFFPQAAKLSSLDWRDKDGHNWTTTVRDQKGCGSCVAFGCMAAFEASMSVYFNAPEPTFDLSEQHLFSCGGGSCQYGWNTPYAFNYLKELGAPDEECYPYRAMDDKPPNFGAPCDETCQDWVVRARKALDWGWVTSHSEAEIKNALMNGPLAVYMTVYSDFFGYSSGVYERVSDHVEGGHIVCMVGWDDDQNCWICKNSWGTDWGDGGWFRIRKGTNESDIEASLAWITPLAAEYPSLKFYAIEVVDSLGDGDGVLNPGETARLRVGIKNQQTWATANSVTAVISSQDPRITFHDFMATYHENIESGQVGWNTSDDFSFTVDEDMGVDQVLLSVEISANSGKPFYSTSLDFYLPVTYYQAGWPVDLGSTVRSSPLLMDMNEDGSLEVVAVDYSGKVHVWDRGGQEEPGFPVAVSGQIWGSPAVGDVNGDGQPEIVFGSSNDTMYAVTSSGSRLFARGLGGSVLSTAALADLDGDDHLETIVGSLDGNLYVLKDDGTDYDPFPISLGGAVFASPSVAHMDDDDILDIVAASLDKKVYAISSSSGEALAGFPITTDGMVVSAPSLADLDGDAHNEVAFGCDDGQLYVVDHRGSLLFTIPSGQMVRSSPAIADLDGDGHLDIVFASKNGKVYAVDNGGNLLSGWPFQAEGFVESSPVIADMDGDRLPEIIFGTAAERLYVVAGNGSLVEEYPTPPTGAIYSSAAIDDLDHDGDYEITLGTPSGLSIWDYKSAASDHRPWPMYRGNCRRTGYFGDNPATAVEPSRERQTLPLRYALSQNYPNPFNAETRIRFSLPEKTTVTLEIFNILGQKVLTLAQGFHEVGLHRITWDGTDSRGMPLASGIYFYRLRTKHFSETKRMVLLR